MFSSNKCSIIYNILYKIADMHAITVLVPRPIYFCDVKGFLPHKNKSVWASYHTKINRSGHENSHNYANATLFLNITIREVYTPKKDVRTPHHIYPSPVIHHSSTRFSTAPLPLNTSPPFFLQPSFEVVPSPTGGANRRGGAKTRG